MTVTLYNTASDPKLLFKVLGEPVASVTATAKGGMVDVDRPQILLDYSSVNFNYLYISDFSRYYNITSRQLLPGSHILIVCESDPLQSFNTGIAALDVLCVRNEDINKWDKSEPDPLMITRAKRVYKGYKFGSMQNVHSNTDATYILGVI